MRVKNYSLEVQRVTIGKPGCNFTKAEHITSLHTAAEISWSKVQQKRDSGKYETSSWLL